MEDAIEKFMESLRDVTVAVKNVYFGQLQQMCFTLLTSVYDLEFHEAFYSYFQIMKVSLEFA